MSAKRLKLIKDAYRDMFELVYDGPDAVPLVSDEWLTADKKYDLLLERFLNLTGNTLKTVYTGLLHWKRYCDGRGEDYMVHPKSKVVDFLDNLVEINSTGNSVNPAGFFENALKALRHLRSCQRGIPDPDGGIKNDSSINAIRDKAMKVTVSLRTSNPNIASEFNEATLNMDEIETLIDEAMKYHTPKCGHKHGLRCGHWHCDGIPW